MEVRLQVDEGCGAMGYLLRNNACDYGVDDTASVDECDHG